MLVFYAVEHRSPWFILSFAAACLFASLYGFLSGAWPFGMVEAIWAVVAVKKPAWHTDDWPTRRRSRYNCESCSRLLQTGRSIDSSSVSRLH
jgi:hypothetical protein